MVSSETAFEKYSFNMIRSVVLPFVLLRYFSLRCIPRYLSFKDYLFIHGFHIILACRVPNGTRYPQWDSNPRFGGCPSTILLRFNRSLDVRDPVLYRRLFCSACEIRTRDSLAENQVSWTARRTRRLVLGKTSRPRPLDDGGLMYPSTLT